MLSSLLKPKMLIIGVALAVLAVAALGCGEEKEAKVLNAAVADLEGPNYNHYKATVPASIFANRLSIHESLLWFDFDEMQPFLATSWTVTENGVTFKLRKDVEFHNGWGKFTAADMVSTWDEATAEGAVSSAGGVARSVYSDVKALDDETVFMDFIQPSVKWAQDVMHWEHTLWVTSKKALDDKGRDWQFENSVGTGPFKVIKHVGGDVVELEAVPNHWRATVPKLAGAGRFQEFDMVKVFQVPEEATRLAQLKTGEIDVSIVSLVNVDQVKDMPGVKLYTGLGGGRSFTVVPAGQYYMTTDREGNALDLTGGKRELHADLPWVGDPSVAGSMESARKVRWAMAMAIDRDLIAETILAGQGCAQYSIYFPDCHPRHEEKWRFDYDPEKAKMYLEEAGYPDGFEFKYAVVQGFPAEYDHISEALIPMWRAVGLEPKIDKANFGDLLNAMQARTLNDLVWIGPYGGYSETIGIAVDNIDFLTDSSIYGTFEYQETRDYFDEAVAKLDQDEAWKVISEFQTWANEQMIMIPTVGWTSPWAAGPKVKDWDIWKMGSFYPSRLEYIVPAD